VDVPLISNQEVWMNISLIKQYHENMPITMAQQTAFTALHRLGLEHIAYKRSPSLNDEERFCVMLLRAVMVREAIVIIDRPFRIIPKLSKINFFMDTLKKIEDLYKSCHIYDYKWMSERYGDLSQ
jgi:ABC-type nitrate/sulfonate/bicarbonate transport system ATPase subunit